MSETNQLVANVFTKISHHRNVSIVSLYLTQNVFDKNKYATTNSINAHYLVLFSKKHSYRRGAVRCVVLVEILPIATKPCRNYLYDKSRTNRSYEEGYSETMCNKHVHSTMTQSSRFYCPIGVINKPTTDELWISPVYRPLAVAKFSKSTM